MSDPRVTIAVSTLASRMPAPEGLPADPRVVWLVLVQGEGEVAVPARPDLRVVRLKTLGLSHSRNAALDLAGTPFLLFADDDHAIDPGAVAALAERLEADPALCLAAGVRADRAGRRRLTKTHRLTRRNSGRLCAPEFMVRRAEVLRRGIRFDTGFGIGARHGLGEDYIFVADLLAAGGRGRAFPIVVGSHAGRSTGENWSAPELFAARIAVLNRVFGPWAWAVRPVYAFRHRARFASLAQAARFAAGRV